MKPEMLWIHLMALLTAFQGFVLMHYLTRNTSKSLVFAGFVICLFQFWIALARMILIGIARLISGKGTANHESRT